MNRKNCPVRVHSILVLGTLRELRRVLNRMKIAVRHCPDCAKGRDCPLMADFKWKLSDGLKEIDLERELR